MIGRKRNHFIKRLKKSWKRISQDCNGVLTMLLTSIVRKPYELETSLEFQCSTNLETFLEINFRQLFHFYLLFEYILSTKPLNYFLKILNKN